MTIKHYLLFLSLITAIGAHASDALIKGSAFYLERIALPANALFEATLEDISLADAPSKRLGSTTIDPATQVPITFEIPYESSAIQQGHRYNVRARITVDGELIYITDTAHPVLKSSDDYEVRLKMKQIRARATTMDEAKVIRASDLPLHLLGTLPGANCEMHYQLDLLSDHAYIIATTCIKDEAQKSKTHYDMGRWHQEKGLLTLKGGREAPLLFSILDGKSIQKRDMHGKPIISALDHTLKASKTAQILEPELLMMGIYDDKTKSVKACLTGIDLPLLDEGDLGELEVAFDEAKKEGVNTMKVHLEAAIVQRHLSSTSRHTQAALIVKRFIKSIPKEHCSNPYVDASLTNTYWRLTMLDKKALVSDTPMRREAHLIFRSPKKERLEVSGSTGCNRFTGSYHIDGQTMDISGNKMAMTKMACPTGGIESAFLHALDKAVSWKIKGDHLELYGEDKKNVLMRFEATYLY